MHQGSHELYKTECPECPSSDAFGIHDDGHGYCYSCKAYVHDAVGDGVPKKQERKPMTAVGLIDPGEPLGIPVRKLKQETCAKWGYTVSEYKGKKVQVANYRNDQGQLVAQKVRFANKDFKFLGDTKAAGLYGQHLWRGGGKRVVITEGELDALSLSQSHDLKWPVVSIPNGVSGAAKAISKALPWLLGYEEIIIMFDQDDVGIAAALECAQLFPPGRCKIVTLPDHDANDLLVAGRAGDLIQAVWDAKTWRPDGLVTIADIRDKVLEPPETGLPWFTDTLTNLTYGRRTGEIYAFGAGTGVGKTDWLTEQMVYDMKTLNMPIGVFALEQNPAETVKRIAGKHARKLFILEDADWEQADLVQALADLEAAGKLFMYDSFGATDWAVISKTIRYLAHSENVKLFYLDHLTALAAAEDDERKALEFIMADMASLCKELGVVIHLISHLATPEGKPHEEGGRVMIRHFKGSRAIGFWCHYMFGLERHQQHKSARLRGVTTFRCLKDRYTGRATGKCMWYEYDHDHGKLVEIKANPFDEDSQDDNVKEAFAKAGQF